MTAGVAHLTPATERHLDLAPLVVLCAAEFLVVLDGLAVAVALPSIGRELGLEERSLQWVLNGYLVAFGGLLVVAGRLGDVLGRRRLFVAGLALFGVASVAAGAAPSAAALVAARVVQGAAAALCQPAALALLAAVYRDPGRRNRALGVWSAIGSVALPAGAVAGGVLTVALGWRWVFLVSAPIAVAAAIGAPRWLPEQRGDQRAERWNVAAGVAVTAAIALVVAAVVEVGDGLAAARVAAVLAGIAAAVVVALAAERRARNPLVAGRMHVDAGRRWVIALAAGLPLGLGAVLFVGTLQLQVLLSLSPLATGVAYTVLAVPVIAGSPLASALANRLPLATVAALGFALQAVGLALLAGSPALLPTWPAIVAGLVAVGFGAPIAYVPLTTVAIDDEAGDSGLASGVFNTVQQVANAVGLAVLAAVASAGASRAVGYAAAYATVAVTMAVIAGLAATVLAARLAAGGYPTGSRASPR